MENSYINGCFFEKTRLEIISAAACVCADGTLLYANKYFKSLARNAKLDGLTSASVRAMQNGLTQGMAEIYEVSFGRRRLKLAGTDINIYDESVKLYLNTDICCRSFPILYHGHIYSSLETLYGKIYIPFFGGELYADSYDKNSRRLCDQSNRLTRIGSVTDIGIKYFCLCDMLMTFCERFGARLRNYGYSVHSRISDPSLAVCLASVYDMSISLELLACCALKLSPSKEGEFLIRDTENNCSIDFEISKRKASNGSRLAPEECFEEGSDSRRVIRSLSKLCEMYSWKLTCRENASKLVFSLTLPKYNVAPTVFREEDDRELLSSVDEALKLMDMLL